MSVVDHNAIELSPRISEANVADYIALLKPRVMSLVIFTALVGLVIAPGHVHPVLAFTSILCIAVGAGASGALNMAYEGDIDALMTRTVNRPIPGAAARAVAFQRFSGLGDSNSRSAGLGLAIVGSLTKASQGSARLTETAGGGLTVEIVLPGG